MHPNPYRYKGPLDPVKHRMVCIPRDEDVQRVIQGIIKGDYWAILGPRQMGKTTFLRQVQHAFSNAHYIYFNFEVPHSNESDFYQWLMGQFLAEIPSAKKKLSLRKWKDSPELGFFDFLKKFEPKDDTKRIILLFDEIDGLSFLKTFLHLWRMVYHERYHKDELKKYVVVITGSTDLIALTVGKTSPFNIAEKLYLKDFFDEESERLIEEPLKQLNIKIEKKAKEKLMTQLSGHPQMLQHACSLLVETEADAPGKPLTEQDVDHAVKILLVTNSSLDTLKQDLSRETLLKQLIKDVLDGKQKKYYPYKEFSLTGAGAIIDRVTYCAIRNSVYEEFLSGLFENPDRIDKIQKDADEHLNIQKDFLNHLKESEQNIIRAVLAHMEQSNIEMINHMLGFIEQGQIQKNKAEEILNAFEGVLHNIQHKELTAPSGITTETIEYYSKTIGDTNRNINHRLKLSIPIIPLFLSYEGERDLISVKNLKEIWKWLKDKVKTTDKTEPGGKKGD